MAVTRSFGGGSDERRRNSSVCSMPLRCFQIRRHQSSRRSSCRAANHQRSFGQDLASVSPIPLMRLYHLSASIRGESRLRGYSPSMQLGIAPSATRSRYVSLRSEASIQIVLLVLMDAVPPGRYLTSKASALTLPFWVSHRTGTTRFPFPNRANSNT